MAVKKQEVPPVRRTASFAHAWHCRRPLLSPLDSPVGCSTPARCPLTVACRLPHVVSSTVSGRCMSSAAQFLLDVVCCTLSIARCRLLVVCCMVSAARWLLHVVRPHLHWDRLRDRASSCLICASTRLALAASAPRMGFLPPHRPGTAKLLTGTTALAAATSAALGLAHCCHIRSPDCD